MDVCWLCARVCGLCMYVCAHEHVFKKNGGGWLFLCSFFSLFLSFFNYMFLTKRCGSWHRCRDSPPPLTTRGEEYRGLLSAQHDSQDLWKHTPGLAQSEGFAGMRGLEAQWRVQSKRWAPPKGLYLLVSLYLASVLKKSTAKATSPGLLKREGQMTG